LATLLLPLAVSAQMTFQAGNDFQGRTFNTGSDVVDLRHQGFNDRALWAGVWIAQANVDAARCAFSTGPSHRPKLMSKPTRVKTPEAEATNAR
jgi:hypothetical protein